MLVRTLVTCLLLLITTAGVAQTTTSEQTPKLLLRHKLATVTTNDLDSFARDYSRWLNYEVRERGRVPRGLAASWGAPKPAGKRYVLLSPDTAPDVYLRAVETQATTDYRPLTTWGWNSIEIVVDKPDALHATLTDSPFKTIGSPAPLGAYPSIRAFQVVGPSNEVLYLTAETGDRSKSPLPEPGGAVGRIFIMVVAGPDIEKMRAFYAQAFKLESGPARQVPVRVVQNALGLPSDAAIGLTTARLAEHGNLLELDGYPASTGARQHAEGTLPPGIALVSFEVRDLDAIELEFISPPRRQPGQAYAGKRVATAIGAAGELIELIER
mgnify:FL=1